MIFTRNISLAIILLVASLVKSQSFELYKGDTINRVDVQNKKQGYWIVMGRHKPGSCYKKEQYIEKGNYLDNRKTGLWIEYFCNGNIKNKLIFFNGRPSGPAAMYHEDGTKSEEGTWYKSRWIGLYTLYYPNGKPQHQFNFDQTGKRFGINKYFYKNGKLAIVGTFEDGLQNGYFLELNPDGRVDTLNVFESGKLIQQIISPNDKLTKEIVELYDIGYESVLKKEVSTLNTITSQKDSEIVKKDIVTKNLSVKASDLELKKEKLEELSSQQKQENIELKDFSNQQTEKVSQQQKVILTVAGISILFIILVIIIFVKFREAKKQKIKIENQNKTIEEKQKEILDSIKYAKRIQSAHLPTEKYIGKNIDRLKDKS